MSLLMQRPSEKVLEQKKSAEEEQLMKGPGTFPLERLLAIFHCIVSVAEDPDDEKQGNDGLGVQSGNFGLMSDVLLQLSSLCNANFVIKGGSCPIEGSTRYRSTISEHLVLKVNFVFQILCSINTGTHIVSYKPPYKDVTFSKIKDVNMTSV